MISSGILPRGPITISPFLPPVIWAFLEPDWRAIRHQLGSLGLRPQEVEQVIAETYPEDEVAADIAASARRARLLCSVGAGSSTTIVPSISSGSMD